jgi:phosphatidylserine decarboxylase
MSLELAWGRVRRWLLRRFRRRYVADMLAKRQGHDVTGRYDIIDTRDLKYFRNVCDYWFRPEDDRFRWRDRLRLARAGLAELLLFSFLFVLLLVLFGSLAVLLHGLFWLPFGIVTGLWVFVISFFRDPERPIPDDPRALVSPADGTITHVEEVSEPDFPGGRAFRISIFLSVFNVHVNRIPRTAKVLDLRYYPGAFLDARASDCPRRNEQLWIDFADAATGQRIRVKQIAGAIARRIVCWLRLQEEVQSGARFGMIKFGSRTDVLIPVDVPREVLVKVGDKVRGGSTVLLRMG